MSTVLKSHLLVSNRIRVTPLSTSEVISWQSVLLAKETGVPKGNRRPMVSNWQTSLHKNVVVGGLWSWWVFCSNHICHQGPNGKKTANSRLFHWEFGLIDWCLKPLPTSEVILWHSDPLAEEIGVPGGKRQPSSSNWRTSNMHTFKCGDGRLVIVGTVICYWGHYGK